MSPELPQSSVELRSLVNADATVELSLVEVPVIAPTDSQVLIRVEAAPINPSDLGLLFAGADAATASYGGTRTNPVVTLSVPAGAMRSMASRVGESMAVGNEGAGTVIAAGSSEGAQALLGRTVAVAGGGMYAQYRCVEAALCLALPEGTRARDGASSFVNPLTTLAMLETMRREGHRALVHTAAASNLGQMLNRLCQEEDVALVNVVRTSAQEELLRRAGARWVCDSSAPTFRGDLVDALRETTATLAFDAVGGGTLASDILNAMEAAAATDTPYSRYGSTVHKQVYVYGALDRSPTVLTRGFGFAWGVGGWLLTPFLQNVGLETLLAMRERVAAGLSSTFASEYSREITLAQALEPEVLSAYARQATGEKYLIVSS